VVRCRSSTLLFVRSLVLPCASASLGLSHYTYAHLYDFVFHSVWYCTYSYLLFKICSHHGKKPRNARIGLKRRCVTSCLLRYLHIESQQSDLRLSSATSRYMPPNPRYKPAWSIRRTWHASHRAWARSTSESFQKVGFLQQVCDDSETCAEMELNPSRFVVDRTSPSNRTAGATTPTGRITRIIAVHPFLSRCTERFPHSVGPRVINEQWARSTSVESYVSVLVLSSFITPDYSAPPHLVVVVLSLDPLASEQANPDDRQLDDEFKKLLKRLPNSTKRNLLQDIKSKTEGGSARLVPDQARPGGLNDRRASAPMFAPISEAAPLEDEHKVGSCGVAVKLWPCMVMFLALC